MTMIERVARAIARYRHGLGDSEKENVLAIDYHWPKYTTEASVAIEAMREPTLTMEISGDATWDHHTPNALEIWQAMIDTALKERA